MGEIEPTRQLESFFAKGLHNSCQATDELIKSILQSEDETVARKALNLYQKYYSTLERPWDHETFMYGLGLIYMHFNAYNWAVKSFRDTVYVRPGFFKSRDVHTRLGLIFKSTGRYGLSEKHFNLAINDTRLNSGTSTKLELEFHLAHLSELKGCTNQAIELYEKLLQEKDLPHKLSANIHRQLGWIHHSDATNQQELSNINCGTSRKKLDAQNSLIETRKLDAALNHLNTSYKTNSDSHTSYYLGRCLTNIGKFQDAFACYRSVIDKEESTADTWCSIGVLYQRQNQPWDALQAYIRSVQYDKKHAVAWMNLGILYESHNQFRDALKCYHHVIRSNPQRSEDESLQDRINYIQKHIDDIEISTSNSSKSDVKSDKLLSLEDLWNMECKANQDSYSSTNSNSNKSDLTKVSNSSQKIQHRNNNPTIPNTNNHPNQLIADSNSNQNLKLTVVNDLTSCMVIDESKQCNGRIESNVDQSTVSKDASISQEFKKEKQEMSTPETTSETSNQIQQNSISHGDTKLNGLNSNHDCKSNVASAGIFDLKIQPMDAKDFSLNQIFTNGASKDSGISSDSSTYADCVSVSSQYSDVSTTNYISAEQVLKACKNSTKLKKVDINLLSDDIKPPSTYPRPTVYPPLPARKLFPSPPIIFLDSKKELTTKRLQEVCQSNPISIVRNIASVLKLDLGLFSTKTLAESNPDERVEIVSHLCRNPDDDNKEEVLQINHWTCKRHLSSSTISRYANYQAASFRQSLQDERDSKTKLNNNTKESETDSNESALCKKQNDGSSSSKQTESRHSNTRSAPATKKFKKDESKIKFVKSANMIDLSDDKKWRSQLNELNKLPHFMKCVSASNMLTHIGLAVPGLNTIVMSMHVPGCKMIGTKTPNLFCSVNINTGPGDYEWCAIPGEYERILRKLCNRNGCDMAQRDWWPRLSDLQQYSIPVYRFAQRPGDLVWVNSSTFYWVNATGWANNIQWNLGPFTARQYQLASESYELNKLFYMRSEVPLVQMTWNIAINISFINDDELSQMVVNVLRRSLRYCKLIRDIVSESKRTIEVSENDLGPRSAKYCSLCESEIFNITFERKHDDIIHCIECARRADDTFRDYKIYQEYNMEYLSKIYDAFISTRKSYHEMQLKNSTSNSKAH